MLHFENVTIKTEHSPLEPVNAKNSGVILIAGKRQVFHAGPRRPRYADPLFLRAAT